MELTFFKGIVILGLLFYVLGLAADVVVTRLRRFGDNLGISVVFLGMALGIITTLPEMSVAWAAVSVGATPLSAGNLLGGIPVIIGLVLGASLLLNRKIETSEDQKSAPFLLGFLLLPVLLGLDGKIGPIDGLLLVGGYAAYLTWIYFGNGNRAVAKISIINRREIAHDLIVVIAAVIGVLVFSDLIVDFTLALLRDIPISQFQVGLLVFAIGTNLPEIAVSLRSWKNQVPHLSLNHLFGSAAANILLLGLIAFAREVPLPSGLPFTVFASQFFLMLVLLGLFIRTGRKLTAREGAVLLAIYLLITGSQAAMSWLAQT